MIKVDIKLQSSYRKHGSSGAKPTKVHAAASSKLNAALSKLGTPLTGDQKAIAANTSSEVAEGEQEKVLVQNSKQAKPYGQHAGNVHVHTFKSYTFNGDQPDFKPVMNYVANLTSHLEGKSSFDLKAAKFAYSSFKDETVAKYAETYGTQLSEVVTTKLLNTLATKAFQYTQHQIVIVITSDKEIDGGRKLEDGNWVLVIKSKMIYTQGRTLLTQSDIQIMQNLSEDDVNLRVVTTTRIPAILIWDAQKEKYIVSYRSSGSIAVFDSY